MNALTLYPEWAYAIAFLGKRVENRTWRPPPGLLRKGDQLAIHGGMAFGGTHGRISASGKTPGAWHVAAHDMLATAKEAGAALPDRLTLRDLIDAAQGKIVAVARYGGAVVESTDPWFGGPVGWLLEDVQVLPQPVACKGAQGLWLVPPGVMEQVRQQLSESR